MLVAEYHGFFSRDALAGLGFRWLHVLAGVTFVGLLYWFNFVHAPAVAEIPDARSRAALVGRVERRAIDWFRWASVVTVITGLLVAFVSRDYFPKGFGASPRGMAITTGMLLGVVMVINVWAVSWRAHQVVFVDSLNVLDGLASNPLAIVAARRAHMVSRQNVVFSVAMLYFMLAASHAPQVVFGAQMSGTTRWVYWIITLVVVGVLELNALGLMPWRLRVGRGLNVLYDGRGARNAVIGAFALWVGFVVLTEVVWRA